MQSVNHEKQLASVTHKRYPVTATLENTGIEICATQFQF